MNPKQRMLAVLEGGKPDKMPFAPFSELIPRAGFEQAWREAGMGFIQHHTSVRQQSSCPVTTRHIGAGHENIYATPLGEVSDAYAYKRGASNDGLVKTGFMIKRAEDYPRAIAYIDGLEFVNDYETDALTDFYLDGMGLTHAWTGEPPYMEAQYYLGLENWAFHQEDYPDEFAALLKALEKMQARRMACVAESRQDMINLGNLAGNFSPDAFGQYMVPYFKKYTDVMRAKGLRSTLHADAANLRAHKELVPACGVDIVEAFTPPPVGDLSLREARDTWGGGVTILINFPETVFYGGYDATFNFTKALLEEDPCPNKIMSLTEMGFVGANTGNMQAIKTGISAVMDAIDRFGVYR